MSAFQPGDEILITETSSSGFVIGRYDNRAYIVVTLIDQDELQIEPMVPHWYKRIIPQMREFVADWDASEQGDDAGQPATEGGV